MSRRLFGTWGAHLDNDSFAQALAALGIGRAHGFRLQPSSLIRERVYHALSAAPMPVSFVPVLSGTWTELPAGFFTEVWEDAVKRFPGPRIEVNASPGAAASGLDVFWIVEQLSRPAVGASSVYVRVDGSAFSIGWNWPLTVGLLGDARSGLLRDAISQSKLQHLFHIVELDGDQVECDILLLPSDLREALQSVLAAGATLHADCILVMGGLAVEGYRASRLVETLLAEVKTSGIGILRVPSEKRAEWFDNLIAELSHNNFLDVALYASSRRLDLPTMPPHAPLLFASRHLLATARLDVYVQRLSSYLAESPRDVQVVLPPRAAEKLRLPSQLGVSALGNHLRFRGVNLDWRQEGGDASDLTALTAELGHTLGSRIKLSRVARAMPPEQLMPKVFPSSSYAADGGFSIDSMDSGVTSAPDLPPDIHEMAAGGPEPTPEARRLQARFLDRPAADAIGEVAERVLLPQTSYVVQVRIAASDQEWGSELDEIFPSDELPPSTAGHQLTVAFVELRRGEDGKPATPQVAPLSLPPTADSAPCEFFVFTGSRSFFRARIIVLFQNRVLQTALLEASVKKEAAEPDAVSFRRETLVRPNFEGISGLQSFDAALVVNDADDGVPGVTAISSTSVTFLEPVGLRQSFEDISSSISQLTSLAEQKYDLNNAELVLLLRQLANYGSVTWRLFSPHMEVLSHARRIQVVEAREGALLPVEFFYDGKSPLNDATLCTHAVPALAAAIDGQSCPNLANAKFTCPTDFWGFNRVIERRPHMDIPYGKEYELSEPTPHMAKLDILSQAVFAASNRVRTEDADAVMREIARATGKEVPRAASWSDLETVVQRTSPSLLVLMPHSLMDPQTPGLAALELGDDVRNISQLDKAQVCGLERDPSNPGRKPGPAVLLLGCSTELTKFPFQNFVSGFQSCGASLVLGTLSTIRGRHAVNFITGFMQELADGGGKDDRTFGDALLRAKRRLLAQGDPFALTLAAYGNAGWLI